MLMLKDWGSGHVLYVERVRDAVDGYTSDAQV